VLRSYTPPKRNRSGSTRLRKLQPGIDITSRFLDELKSIDENLYLVWHPYKVIYEALMNQYTGPEGDDQRFNIHEEYGQEVWGYPTKASKHDGPQVEAKWHVWYLHQEGYYHVSVLEDTDPRYLDILARRLYLQSVISDKYGKLHWNRMQREEQERYEQAKKTAADDLFNQVQKENSWLVAKAADNFRAGKTAPTNPTREIITSYQGQGNKSKIIRPVSDTEGGLVLPDNWEKTIV
jgi:hypothetical protein